MSLAWLELDGVPEAELPAWAQRGEGDRVVLGEQGIAEIRGGRGVVARWSDVLGVARVGDDVYVLIPRRPPGAPWIAIAPEAIEGDLRGRPAVEIESAVRSRIAAGGYRDATLTRPTMSPEELERRVRAREAIPGAVEVPVAMRIAPASLRRGAVYFGGIVGGTYGLPALLTGAAVALGAEPGLLVPLLYGGLVGGMLAGIFGARRLNDALDARILARTPAPRMLVLAPDGCMVAFETGARAFSWDQIGGFRVEALDPNDPKPRAGDSALIVVDPAGREYDAIDGAWFGAPLSLVAAVAEAYRARARRATATAPPAMQARAAEEVVEVPLEVEVPAERARR